MDRKLFTKSAINTEPDCITLLQQSVMNRLPLFAPWQIEDVPNE